MLSRVSYYLKQLKYTLVGPTCLSAFGGEVLHILALITFSSPKIQKQDFLKSIVCRKLAHPKYFVQHIIQVIMLIANLLDFCILLGKLLHADRLVMPPGMHACCPRSKSLCWQLLPL